MELAREAVFYVSTHQIVQVEVHLQSPVLDEVSAESMWRVLGNVRTVGCDRGSEEG